MAPSNSFWARSRSTRRPRSSSRSFPRSAFSWANLEPSCPRPLFTPGQAVVRGGGSGIDALVPLGDLPLPGVEGLRRLLVLRFRLQDLFLSADQIPLSPLEDFRRRVLVCLRLHQALLAGLEVRFRLLDRGFTGRQLGGFRGSGARRLETLCKRVRPMGLGLKLGLRASEFGLEFDLAALESPVRRMQRFLEPVDRLVPLRNLAVASLKKFASFVEFLRVRLLSRLFPLCELFLRLLQLLICLLDAALPLFDRLEGVLCLENSFRRGPRRLRRGRFALPDPSLAARQRGLALPE